MPSKSSFTMHKETCFSEQFILAWIFYKIPWRKKKTVVHKPNKFKLGLHLLYLYIIFFHKILNFLSFLCCFRSQTTDTQWRHKSKISERLGRCGRHNMLWPYLKIWDWDWIFGRAVKAISSFGVRSPWILIQDIWWASENQPLMVAVSELFDTVGSNHFKRSILKVR